MLWDPAGVVLHQDKKAPSVNNENQRSTNYHACSSAPGTAILECFFPISPWRAGGCFWALQHWLGPLQHTPGVSIPCNTTVLLQ